MVLGYIANESCRFYIYVANRVQIIRSLSTPEQWRYVEIEHNPADLATCGVTPSKIMETSWLTGLDFLRKPESVPQADETIELSTSDPEVRKEVFSPKAKTTKERRLDLGAERFERFSSLKSLQRAIANLIVVARELKRRRDDKTRPADLRSKPADVQGKLGPPTLEEYDQALRIIISTTQRAAFGELLTTARPEPDLPREVGSSVKKALKGSQLYCLLPFLNSHRILRVGGRLTRAEMEHGEKHPIALPKNNHVSRLVAKHYHLRVHHQGRQITRGAIRQAGF